MNVCHVRRHFLCSEPASYCDYPTYDKESRLMFTIYVVLARCPRCVLHVYHASAMCDIEVSTLPRDAWLTFAVLACVFPWCLWRLFVVVNAFLSWSVRLSWDEICLSGIHFRLRQSWMWCFRTSMTCLSFVLLRVSATLMALLLSMFRVEGMLGRCGLVSWIMHCNHSASRTARSAA